MKFKTANGEYKIMWKKEHEKYRGAQRKHLDKVNTRCVIYIRVDDEWVKVNEGLSKLHWLDRNRHNKYRGKKEALRRALEIETLSDLGLDNATLMFSKQDRTRLWFDFNALFKKLDPAGGTATNGKQVIDHFQYDSDTGH